MTRRIVGASLCLLLAAGCDPVDHEPDESRLGMSPAQAEAQAEMDPSRNVAVLPGPVALEEVDALLNDHGLRPALVYVHAAGLWGSVAIAPDGDWNRSFRQRAIDLVDASREGRLARLARVDLRQRSDALSRRVRSFLEALVSMEERMAGFRAAITENGPVVTGVRVRGPERSIRALESDPRVVALASSMAEAAEPQGPGSPTLPSVEALTDEELLLRARTIARGRAP